MASSLFVVQNIKSEKCNQARITHTVNVCPSGEDCGRTTDVVAFYQELNDSLYRRRSDLIDFEYSRGGNIVFSCVSLMKTDVFIEWLNEFLQNKKLKVSHQDSIW